MAEAIFYDLPELQLAIKDSYPVTFRFTDGKGPLCEFTDRVATFAKRERNSKIAQVARRHGESGLPAYFRKKDVPHFSPENFQVIVDYLKFGPSRLVGENRKQIQMMSVNFLEYWGLHMLKNLRHKQHDERVRRLSHMNSVDE